MQTMESINAKLANVGQPGSQVYFKGGTGGTDWNRPRTRDEMIAHFETDWDKLKNFWAANPETAAGTADAFNLQSFNTFGEWKNWFIQQHPTNEVVMGQGSQPTTGGANLGQPNTNLPQTGQPTPPVMTPTGQPNLAQPTTPSGNGFDVGSLNYKTWNNAFGNISLPGDTSAKNKLRGMTTGFDNPYFKNLFR